MNNWFEVWYTVGNSSTYMFMSLDKEKAISRAREMAEEDESGTYEVREVNIISSIPCGE